MDLKTYKTWEVIKMITENKKLKFKNYLGEEMRYDCNRIRFFRNGKNERFYGIKGNEEWILVQKPVDFMTAVKSGKKIKVEHQLTKCLSISEDYCNVHNVFDVLGNILNDINIREVIAEGKFYIEE